MDDEQIDVPALKTAVEHAVDGGVHGLVVLGSNGEGPLLSEQAKETAMAATVEAVRGRVPVLAGTGEPGTRLAVRTTRRAKELGCAGTLLCPPFYIPLTQDQVIRHYETVVEQVDLPVLIYNYPAVTGVKMEIGTIERLARDPRIQGIKDSGGDFAFHQQLLSLDRSHFSVFQSWEDFMHASLWSGSDGSMSPTPSVFPQLSVELWNLVQAGERAEAIEQHKRLMACIRTLTRDPWPAGWKAATHLLGFGSARVCLPNQTLDAAGIARIRTELSAQGLLH